jgi:hypothetical protein
MLRRSSRYAVENKKSKQRRTLKYIPRFDKLEAREMLTSTVTVTAPQPNASEPSTAGVFSFIASPSFPPVTVYYSVSGTASNGVDYQNISGSITVGGSSGSLTIIPIDDSLIEGTEKVTVTIQANPNYIVGTPSSATVSIADNESGQGSTAPATCPGHG